MIAVELFAERLLTWLGSLSLQAAVLIGLALLLAFAVRRASPRLRHLIWLIVLLRLAVPVGLSSPFGLLAAPPPTATAMPDSAWARMNDGLETAVSPGGAGAPVGRTAGPERSRSLEPSRWSSWLAAGWIAGVMVLFGVVVVRARRARRLLAAASAPDDPMLSEVSDLSRRLGIEPPRVKIAGSGTRLPSPAAFGLRRPTILLPEAIVTRWTAAEREPLLVHELAHLRRRDLWVNSLQLVVQTLYFFHPLVWLANRSLRVARELACDEDVARFYGPDSNRYARALLRAARGEAGRHSSALAVTLATPRSLLGRRVQTLLTRRASSGRWSWMTLTAVLAGSLSIVALAAARPTQLSPEIEIPTDPKAWLAFVEELWAEPDRQEAVATALVEQVRSGASNPELLGQTLELIYDYPSPSGERVELRSAWEERLETLPDDLPTLRAAASFFVLEDHDRAHELLHRGWEMQPGAVSWPLELARLEYLTRNRLSGDLYGIRRAEAARRALELLRTARPLMDESQLYNQGSFFARAAYGAGEMALAREYALELLEAAESRGEGWNYGNAIHHGHTVLGLVALAESDRDEAVHQLLLAGDTPGSPQLNSFGPSFKLAADLFALGEREAVLDYLDRCAAFWASSEGRLESWTAAALAGEQPSFRDTRY